MPRVLNDKPCEVTFFDRVSNSRLTLSYRLPTTEEIVGYQSEQITRQGGRVKSNVGAARIKYGLKILSGFKEGSFEREEGKPLSSDPKSPHYDPAWKTFIHRYASDVLVLLAAHAFDASVVPAGPADAPEEDQETESTEAAPPEDGKKDEPGDPF